MNFHKLNRTVGLTLMCLASMVMFNCAAVMKVSTQDYDELMEMEEERRQLEMEYIYVLQNLEKYPTDFQMLQSQAKIQNRLRTLKFKLIEKRDYWDLELKRWEEKVLAAKLEKQMVEQVIKERAHIKEQDF